MGHNLKFAGWVSIGVVAGALTTVSLQTVARGAMTPLPLEEIQQLSAVFGLVKLRDDRPGLVFGPDGFTDNASATAAGFVPWSEVTGVGVMEFNRQKMLVVGVRDPEKYLARGGALKQMLGRANARMCGSPIVISAHALKTDFGALLTEFEHRLDRYAADARRNA